MYATVKKFYKTNPKNAFSIITHHGRMYSVEVNNGNLFISSAAAIKLIESTKLQGTAMIIARQLLKETDMIHTKFIKKGFCLFFNSGIVIRTMWEKLIRKGSTWIFHMDEDVLINAVCRLLICKVPLEIPKINDLYRLDKLQVETCWDMVVSTLEFRNLNPNTKHLRKHIIVYLDGDNIIFHDPRVNKKVIVNDDTDSCKIVKFSYNKDRPNHKG